jgi:hypothetical protein
MGAILDKCRVYETIDDLRRHCEEPQMWKGEITLREHAEGIALMPEGSRLPTDATVFDPAKVRDIDTAERIWSHTGEVPYMRVPVRLVGVEIVTPTGQRQVFSAAVKV